jgi:hypothetical protein
MKVSSLFNIITDGSDLLDLFTHVDSPEQLVSRLERLKRQGTEELLSCIEGLRSSIAEALDDTIELSPSLDDDDEEEDDLLSDEEIAGIADEEEKPIPAATEPPTEEKNP